MEPQSPLTVDEFYEHCASGKLLGARCRKCKNVFVLRNICPKCRSDKADSVPLSGKGELQTYTIIHVAPARFQSIAPYAVGIVRLEEGVQLPGIIRNVKIEDLKVGMNVAIGFDLNTQESWPQWPRYYFEKV